MPSPLYQIVSADENGDKLRKPNTRTEIGMVKMFS